MKKTIPYIAIFLIVLVGGIYYAVSTNKSNTSENTNTVGQDDSGQPFTQSHRGYDVQVTSDTSNIKPGLTTKVRYKIVNDRKEVLKDFTVAHDKIMHFILVRKDLQNFQHLHPDFNQQTGEFSVNVIFPTDGPYRLFPDFTPTPENPQELPVTANFDIAVGDQTKYKPQPLIAENSTSKTAGGLTIDYFFGSTPRTGAQLDYALTISDPNNNEQVQLESYLGAMGHGVIIKENTLDFIHTHATGMYMDEMEGMSASEHAGHRSEPDTIDFSATFSEPGMYKIFTQFQHLEKVNTVDYVIEVE